MGIIRNHNYSENSVNYIETATFFFVISCTIIMLRFLGFKASLNFGSSKSSGIEHRDNSTGVSLNGVYRANRDDSFGSVNYAALPKKITPCMVKLPERHTGPPITPSKSTNNLAQPSNEVINYRKSAPDIPELAKNKSTKAQIKDQKNLEKQRLVEQRRQEKIAAKEREREEKLRKEREEKNRKEREEKMRKEREEMIRKERDNKIRKERDEKIIKVQEKQTQPAKIVQNNSKTKKRTAPQPQQLQTQRTVPLTDLHSQRSQSNTNTLESSISRTSGPPPYSDVPELKPCDGDTSFGNRVDDTGSWDIITQHRQQMSRQAAVSKTIPKQTHLDLHYNPGSSNAHAASGTDKSDA